ncbi:ribulokinase [Roseivirga sp. BDSF3-8]|uniref:ribulokinase n=1 Tax=Roseivirga sp. BDSF3-8 TaxID=3241598 RepID=UPI003531B177
MSEKYVIGLDFGTDSVRSVLVNAQDGTTVGSKVSWYRRWKEGRYCDASANRFRQHPLDHIEGMEYTIREVVKEAGVAPASVKGICIDTTGSSPLPVDAEGRCLALKPGMEENPNAMVVLWKDHTAIQEADEINGLAASWGGTDFTKYEGGIYSSEWFWAKILHVIREDEAVKAAGHSWMEHCDYMTFMLTDVSLQDFKRSRCAAGHKAMWHQSWGGLPADDFLAQLDPHLVTLKNNLYEETYTSDLPAGKLNAEWAERLGLTTDVSVAVGTFDAHAGAVGAEVEEFSLVRVMGTSTCDIIVSSRDVVGDETVRGICGQVDGSVIPGMIGLEAGQSAFGDVLAWFRDIVAWPLTNLEGLDLSPDKVEALKDELIVKLSQAAEKLPLSEHAPVALDWVNGRRTPDANQALKAAIANLNLGTGAPHIFKALVEAICFGARSIVERFEQEGVHIKTVVGIGGVAKKSGFIMQTLADVLNMPIRIANSEQAPALGAAMYAAVAAGIYPDVHQAIQAMGNGFEQTYQPQAQPHAIFNKLYARYRQLGAFVEDSLTPVTETEDVSL